MDTDIVQRILIVDDTPENIDILTSTLTEYKKSIALNGEKALELAIGNNPPDLILLDIHMPGLSGFDVCKRLKADAKTKEIPIIFLTGETDSVSVVKGFQLGAVDYVTKPFNTSELLARVRTHMALKKSKDDIARYVVEIEEKNLLITESINYARRIQNAVLPMDAYLRHILPDHFVMYRPKDIVSGDFYWVRKMDHKTMIVAADSTGHGVPGAFMSMFGIAFLNEIVGKENMTKPSLILDRLREMIIQSLRQDSGNSLKDGMDMSAICIDNRNKILEFSGAQNPMYLVRNNELMQIDSDSMPVSIHILMKEFTNHSMEIQQNDQIYIFSDGFADQFGGPKDKKFTYKAFKNLILKNSDRPMKEQKEMLEKAFDDWMGNNEQVDDVVVMGIQL